jgi:hypothetical protein
MRENDMEDNPAVKRVIEERAANILFEAIENDNRILETRKLEGRSVLVAAQSQEIERL